MKNKMLPYIFLVAGGCLLSSAEAGDTRAWPVVCEGPILSTVYPDAKDRNTLVVSLGPRAGGMAGQPRPGQCVWLDRAMDRPEEYHHGDMTDMEFRVPVHTARLVNENGRQVYTFPGYPDADRIWKRAQKGGRFRMNIRRVGKGRYEVVLPPPPAQRTPRATPAPSRSQQPSITARPAPRARDREETVYQAPSQGRQQTIGIKLDRIEVINDGDSVSPGDWFVSMVVMALPDGSAVGMRRFKIASKRWPERSTKNVKSGQTYRPEMEVFLRDIDPSRDWLMLAISATDCDSDGPFDLLDIKNLILPHRLPKNILSERISGSCEGEEVFEVSGNPDVALKTVELPPQDWRRGRPFNYTVSGNGVKFKVWGRIRVLR